MLDFTFSLPTKILFGRGYESSLGERIASLGASRVLVVFGQGSVERSGLLTRVCDSLLAAKLEVTRFGGVSANPLLSKVEEGIALARQSKCDFLLAVGGGSVIDATKAIAIGVPYQGDVWDFFGFEASAVPQTALSVGTVLTIAAAGSEISNCAVITRDEGMQKRSVKSDNIRPVFSVLNPENAASLSSVQVACGVADMLAHVMERYFTNTSHVTVTDIMCLGVMNSIVFNAPIAVDNPRNYDAMSELMLAAAIAHSDILGVGREQDWASHKMGHELSSAYGVPHGESLAMIFPAWLRYVLERRDAVRISRFAREVFEIDRENTRRRALEDIALDGVDALEAFFRNLGLRTHMNEVGAKLEDCRELARRTAKPQSGIIGSFVKLDEYAIERIFKKAY